MSKKYRKSDCCQPTSCGCPTPRVCCSNVAVPTTAYQMCSVPQLVYDNVPASSYGGMSPYGVSPASYGGGGHVAGYDGGCGGYGSFGGWWIIIIILLLCCCGGNNFGGGCNDGCGDGFGGFGSWWIIIIILLLCCGGSGFGGFGC